ncbi:hypothetical protein POM88_006225 [Heracleum sosnowskyi]|uniref:Uncharacterized protein n=1 Tax=Heracleum sosnowskyi TaxID=360622 RepID=A0AAD8N554_9APIA|nr:hypothetical protein POM88_006225 [Heracleum sosnowskyi]
MESDEEKKKIFSEVSDIKLIDFLNEDDFLVDHRFRDSLEDLRLSVSFREISEHAKSFKRVNRLKAASTESNQHQREEKLPNSGSLEPKSADPLQERIERDKAFCPSKGVSGVKELSAISEELKKQEPIISEDKSVDLDFALESFESHAFSLECLEEDIFDDVRASIYRSCGTPIFSSASRDSVVGKASPLNALSNLCEVVVVSARKHITSYSDPLQIYILKLSCFQRNSSADLRKLLPGIRKSKAMTTSPLHPQNLQHIKGGYNSTPTGQTKRDLWGYGNVKNRKTGEGSMIHKLSASVDSPGFMNFLTPPTKSSYRSPRSATKSPSLARSSYDQFSSTLSSKPLSSRGTRRTGTNSSKIASSGSISKPPLGYSGRSRLSNQSSSIHLLSMSHQFNSSPASSIGRWSSQSSSSAFRATAKLRSGNSEGKLKRDQFTPTKMSPDQHFKGAPKEVSPVKTETPKGSEVSPVPAETPKGSKPSGLRMPSPKHGFFDEVSKSFSSFGETPQSSKPSGLRKPSPKHGFFDEVSESFSPFGGTPISSKPSFLRVPSPRHGFFDEEKSMVRSTIDTMQLFQLSSPDVLSDPNANAFIRRNVPGNRKNIGSPLTPSQPCFSSTTPQHSMHSKERDDVSTLSTGIGNGIKTEEKRNKSMSKNTIGKEGKDEKAQNGISLDTMQPVKKGEEAARELLVESNHHLLCESKVNFEDQVKNLNIYFEVIDLAENATELDGQKSNAGAQDESVNGEQFPRGQQEDSPSISRIQFAEVSTTIDEASTFPSSDSAKKEYN